MFESALFQSFLYRIYGLGEIQDDQVRLEPEETAFGPVTPRSRMFSQMVKGLDLKNGKGLYSRQHDSITASEGVSTCTSFHCSSLYEFYKTSFFIQWHKGKDRDANWLL